VRPGVFLCKPQCAAREISVPIFEPHPKIGAEIDREALKEWGIGAELRIKK
jgi:hypothetical protein